MGVLCKNLLYPAIPHMQIEEKEATLDGYDMRVDFVLTGTEEAGHRASKTAQGEDGPDGDVQPKRKYVCEVKTVVDTDYSHLSHPDRKDCLFLSYDTPYQRAAIFPWGRAGQHMADGRKVVSARAVKHLEALTR